MPTRTTPGYAKNQMRRALRAINDVELSRQEKATIWKYFNSTCAYCGQKLRQDNREGHLDHLIARGTNHISNRVLSCGPCNGDLKRDMDWRGFLRKTAPNLGTFRKRCAKIQKWSRSNRVKQKYVVQPAVQKEIDRAILAFDTAVEHVRQLRKL